jgi:hypothetical protein
MFKYAGNSLCLIFQKSGRIDLHTRILIWTLYLFQSVTGTQYADSITNSMLSSVYAVRINSHLNVRDCRHDNKLFFIILISHGPHTIIKTELARAS